MDQALRHQVLPVQESQDPRDRDDAVPPVPAGEGPGGDRDEQGRAVGGGGAGAQADRAAHDRREEVSVLGRIGLAITRPRAALAIAGDRDHPGRSGSDLLATSVVFLVATQLRWLVQATWLGFAVAGKLGLASLTKILTGTLTLELAALVISAMIIFVAAGAKREPGRAFDIACVAALPPIGVHLVAQTVVSVGNLPMPNALRRAVEIVAFGWMAVIVVLAVLAVRSDVAAPSSLPMAATRAGWLVATVALASFAVQVLWVVQNADILRPLQT